MIVDNKAINRDFAALVLTAAGWWVATAAGGQEALATLCATPALILMDLSMDGMTGAATVAAIRARGGAYGSVPIVAFTTTRVGDMAHLHASGFDDLLPKPCTPDELTATAARWWPDDAAAVLDRLEAGLGAAQIATLSDRFRDQLADAVAGLDGGGDIRGIAHRVAGIAGTLGFAGVGAAWLALSEGADDARAGARREARRAIATLDRRRIGRDDTTSV